ncbi:protein MIZU-KUSSEI 1-like [Zingiber officinale]|uniref:Protein MIZU-KUSSEI 1 n=1 Tax=Zingiber officinale TaxID=94328 RepID=A0A8J5C594_ZINOF|nr:protein MIZU-KUSSEI 1-like [Zingiber officinale]KAG6473095.1 hypothetical protein ZIOFF_067002 [Zingiber officinale]
MAASTALAAAMPPHFSPSRGASEAGVPKKSTISLVAPSARHRRRPARVIRVFRSICRTLPIFTPKCKIPSVACSAFASPLAGTDSGRRHRDLVTGTLFGCRKGRVSFSIQEDPRCLPSLFVEFSLQTHVLLREMSTGMLRIALECGKNGGKAASSSSRTLLEEPMWALFCNGKRSGYGVRREATVEDLGVMETLRAVSMGAGVMPAKAEGEEDIAYVRAAFDHVIASKDTEILYMLSPEDGSGPDLTIFFIRL